MQIDLPPVAQRRPKTDNRYGMCVLFGTLDMAVLVEVQLEPTAMA